MKFTKTFAAALMPLSWCIQSSAAPVEFDTADAHVVVARPADTWSGDASVSEVTLDAIRNKEALYYVATTLPTGKAIHAYGGSNVFGGINNYPVTKGVEATLIKNEFKLIKSGYARFDVFGPISVPPSEMAAVTQAQTEVYKRFVISQGDPIALSDKVRAKKVVGGLLALGSTLLAMDKFGATLGSSATLGSGLTDDIYRVASKNSGALAPVNLPAIDFTQYKSVDVRKVVGAADRLGQIIIAYKGDKTPEAEQEALIQAIAVTAGVGTTVAEVEKSRASDLENRVSIWKTWCSSNAATQCKIE